MAALLWLPNLFTKGMFMDGVFHALFAHNFVNGIGSFWSPQTADYVHPEYWDNPQLSSYFLSLWYKALGDYYWVEKLYSLACAIIQLLLISSLWKIYFADDEEQKSRAWLPCLLFLLIPLTSWCYSSNLMENCMTIFTTGAVISFVLHLRTGKNLLPYSIIGGALIFLALITKGPVALFPLAAPAIFASFEKDLKWKNAIAYTFLQLAVLVLIFAFVFSMEAPKNFLQHYIDVQLMRALKHEGYTPAPPYTIFIQLFVALIIPIAVVTISGIFTGKDAMRRASTAAIFILIGLSASAPIAISAKQNKHYLLPSLPMFAIGLSCFILPAIKWLDEQFETFDKRVAPVAKAICIFVVAGCITLSVINAGTNSRYEFLMEDIEAIQTRTKNESLIQADWVLYGDWGLKANLNRFYDKKICMPDEAKTNFYITIFDGQNGGVPANAVKVYSGKMYNLYKLQP